ncbi:YwiC-like family protein [Salisediminibacterium halotolerans]|uniref:YwiC-like family protein n=1 Tax=Salisediminibacterium halotolerans TaxID=517425 RepID=UPI000F147783|nr:YwiC-like family protein [Salisediminibacterium halotolerans]RLJ74453.1 YwiC-like protein [Actinophytocola xinjiangensis]RPE87454.1 YwiC-like protein [Salisediminibacterium halotolerans]TWG35289.1 YwiC-like protein [Salisediminibacterium halotolerans]GEL06771.1 membrane protein [Salisediminibacterium halotolerans]
MKWYFPREHGAWAMLVFPYWTGAVMAGVSMTHGLFFAGIFFVYLLQAPLLAKLRQAKRNDIWPSFLLYSFLGAVFLLPQFWRDPEVLALAMAALPFFFINMLFAKLKKERLLVNDLAAITGLSWLLVIAFYLGEGFISAAAVLYAGLYIFFFMASVFHVKSLIRERNNPSFHRISFVYYLLLPVGAVVLNLYAAAAAFFLTFIKAALIPSEQLRRPMQIGMIEMVNSIIFFVLILAGYF